MPLPDGCGNPFVQDGIFGDFYDKIIRTGLIETGSVTPAYVKLFAVNVLRKTISEKFPNPESGDVIDRHIRAQICVFATGKDNVNSASPELYRHFEAISTKLLRDIKKLVTEIEAKEKAKEKLLAKFEARQGLIDRAERLAKDEVKALLTKF